MRKKMKRSPSGYVTAEETPTWLEWVDFRRLNDEKLFRIVTFYVFHSPCTKPKPLSAMSRPITDYGWSQKWANYRTPTSLNYILRKASTTSSLIYSAVGNNDIQQACEKADLLDNFPSNIDRERVAIALSDQNQFLSLFRHIRNALSHGRLSMKALSDGDVSFILEDIATNRVNVSARMILRRSTLLKWIEIIENGPINE